MTDTQAIAARLTAKQIAEQFLGEKSYDSQQEILHSFTVSALTHAIERALSAHVETLTQQVADWSAANEVIRQDFEDAKEENARLTEQLEQTARDWVSTEKRAEQAEQQRDEAHAALVEYQEAYVKAIEDNTYSNGEMKHRDHACAQCGPVVEGWEDRNFVCRYHRAKADAGLAASAPQKE